MAAAPAPARRPPSPARLAVLAVLVALVLVVAAPLVVIVLNAFKEPADYAANGPLSLPERIHLAGIVDFWQRVDFGQKLLNSLVISGSVAVLGLVVSILNAYALGRPTLAVLVTFFFIWTWNEFFLPLVFLISNDKQTVPVALGVLQGQRLMDATATSASGLLGILPAMIFFLIFQRTLTRGIMSGAIR